MNIELRNILILPHVQRHLDQRNSGPRLKYNPIPFMGTPPFQIIPQNGLKNRTHVINFKNGPGGER